MNKLFDSLVSLVETTPYYINSLPSNKEEFTLHCFRHAVSESKLDLFNLTLEIIKHYDFEIADNEYFMFEFLITRQLRPYNKLNPETLAILDVFFSDCFFNSLENTYIQFYYILAQEILELIENKEVKTLHSILSVKSINSVIFNTKHEIYDKVKSKIFQFKELSVFKTKQTLKNF
jgi:hypothetical protein